MFADFEYYKKVFGGNAITTADEYKYLGQKASRYILKYTSKASASTKDCECALAEYLLTTKSSGISSETIPNAYSVTYSSKDEATKMNEIGAILELYLGSEIYSSVGIVKLIG